MAEEKSKEFPKIVVPFLVILLMVASFLIGSLFNQLKSLKGTKSGETAQPAQSPAPSGATQQAAKQGENGGVLGAEDWAKIEQSTVTKGNLGAKITIVEFSEYQCPFCKKYVDDTYPQIFAQYGDKIYYVFHDYPLPFHANAQKAAEAARCAGDAANYWGYHDLLFKNHDEWADKPDPTDLFVGYAQKLGLDKDKFKTCLTSGKFSQAVKDDLALGQKVSVNGTPSFFINGRMLVGAQPFENFKFIIEEELKK